MKVEEEIMPADGNWGSSHSTSANRSGGGRRVKWRASIGTKTAQAAVGGLTSWFFTPSLLFLHLLIMGGGNRLEEKSCVGERKKMAAEKA